MKELRIIVYDFLQLAPMYTSLVNLIKQHKLIPEDSEGESGVLKCSDVLTLLNTVEFINETAKVSPTSPNKSVHEP
jgi:hypothetical protein